MILNMGLGSFSAGCGQSSGLIRGLLSVRMKAGEDTGDGTGGGLNVFQKIRGCPCKDRVFMRAVISEADGIGSALLGREVWSTGQK